jgi:L-alanine-DL-glutamate epimerase-like enolase superfamily enzyme
MAAVRNFLIQEWDAVMEDTFMTLSRGSFPKVNRGHVALSDKPGLGIDMDWAEWDKRFPYKTQSLRPPGGVSVR